MKGVVIEWKGYIKGWKERVLEIEDGKIKMYKDDTGSGNPKVVVSCDDVVLKEYPGSDTRFKIDDGANTIHLRANDQATRDQWIAQFQKNTVNAGTISKAALKKMDKIGSRYFLGKDIIGEGGFAYVRSGIDAKTGDRIAAKVMEAKRGKKPEHQKEIHCMGALKNKHVVELRDIVVQDGLLYMIMELASGGELFAKVAENGRLEEESAREYFKQTMLGVLYCHNKNLCHRDLKLENLLLDATGSVVKITDFGFAKDMNLTMPKTTVGTAVYVAPEILEGGSYDGAKADVWSCGVILYTMVCGRYPFDVGTTAGVGPDDKWQNKKINRILTEANFKLRKDHSAELNDLLTKIFNPKSDERLTAVDCLRHPWTVGNEGLEAIEKQISECIDKPDEETWTEEKLANTLSTVGSDDDESDDDDDSDDEE